MTLKVKVKVTQGQISTIYANASVMHGESSGRGQMTFKVKVKVIQGHLSTLYENVGDCMGSIAKYVP
jgi:hypothetical protein